MERMLVSWFGGKAEIEWSKPNVISIDGRPAIECGQIRIVGFEPDDRPMLESIVKEQTK